MRTRWDTNLTNSLAPIGPRRSILEDKYKRAEYLKALDEIQIEERARFLDAARAEYWRRNGRDIERVADLLAGPDPMDLERVMRWSFPVRSDFSGAYEQ